jgi:hypothetical protein
MALAARRAPVARRTQAMSRKDRCVSAGDDQIRIRVPAELRKRLGRIKLDIVLEGDEDPKGKKAKNKSRAADGQCGPTQSGRCG